MGAEPAHSVHLTQAAISFVASITDPKDNSDVWAFLAARMYLHAKALEFAAAEGPLDVAERAELAALRIFREQVESLGWNDGPVVPSAAADEMIALAKRVAV